MQPSSLFNDAGTATPGTLFGGAYTGPDVDQATGLTFLDIDRDVTVYDAISMLSTGAAPANAHAYLISVGDVQNVVGFILSVESPPNSNLRRPPALKFKAGQRVFVRGVQLSGAAAEATQLKLLWAKPAVGGVA